MALGFRSADLPPLAFYFHPGLRWLLISSKDLSSTSTRVTNDPASLFLPPDLKPCFNSRCRGSVCVCVWGALMRMESQKTHGQLGSQFLFPPRFLSAPAPSSHRQTANTTGFSAESGRVGSDGWNRVQESQMQKRGHGEMGKWGARARREREQQELNLPVR